MNGIQYRKPGEMRNSEAEWQGSFPRDWYKTKLKFVALIRNGATPSTSVPEYWDGNIHWFTPTDFGKQNLTESARTITKQGLNSCGTNLVPKGSVLITCRAPIGNLGIIERENAAYNQGCKAVIPTNATSKYLYYLMLSASSFVQSRGKGTTFMELSSFDLNNLKIVIADVKDQHKIANFLDIETAQFDSIIAKKESLIKKLEEAKKSLISEVVTGKIKIVDGEMVPRKPEEMKDSGIEWLGMIPKDWIISKLKNLTIRITDGAHISPDLDNGQYPFLSVKDMTDNGLDFDKCLLTSSRNYRYLLRNACNPRINDIIISKDGTIGKTTTIDYDRQFVVASSLVIISPIKRVNSYYFEYLLNSNYVQEQIRMFTKGAALPRLSLTKLKTCRVLYTGDYDEQMTILSYLNERTMSLDDTIVKIMSQIDKVKMAKQSLISEAVTGKIDLRDWQITEEGELH